MIVRRNQKIIRGFSLLIPIWGYSYGILAYPPILSGLPHRYPCLGRWSDSWSGSAVTSLVAKKKAFRELTWEKVNKKPWGPRKRWTTEMISASALSDKRTPQAQDDADPIQGELPRTKRKVGLTRPSDAPIPDAAASGSRQPDFLPGRVSTTFDNFVEVMTLSGKVKQRFLTREAPFIVEFDPPATTHISVEEASELAWKSHRLKGLIQESNLAYNFMLEQANEKIRSLTMDMAKLQAEACRGHLGNSTMDAAKPRAEACGSHQEMASDNDEGGTEIIDEDEDGDDHSS
ncbi:hypothetical protein M5689_000732 [Euphorbia peplus]|nr:hypothetical protein M5689_000732 [Euphorbia peplus]